MRETAYPGFFCAINSMRKRILFSIIFLMVLALSACAGMPDFTVPDSFILDGESIVLTTPVPEATATPEPTPTPTFTPIPTFTPTPTITPTPEPDYEPPVILGVEPLKVIQGNAVSYKKGIEITDNADENVRLEVDNSQVDLNTPGEYRISYTATDKSGNMTIVFTTITVRDSVLADKEDTVNQMADEIIASIITDDMSAWDKAYKLWNWCRTNIAYTSATGDMTSEYTGAYEGLHDRKGDCYSYYATYKILLDKVGIENLQCTRMGGSSEHYWNLVNLGNGWYHCDCSPRRKDDPFRTFMQTDNQVAQYERSYEERPDYYTFDKDAYPERGTLVIYDGWTHTKLKTNVTIYEKDLQAKIQELKAAYPDGKYWNHGGVTDTPCNHKLSYSTCNNRYSVTNLLKPKTKDYGTQCYGFACLLQDYCFGENTAVFEHRNFDEVRVGDHIRVDNDSDYCHSMFVIEKHDDYVVVAECNANYKDCKIEWGRKVTQEELNKSNISYYSRSYILK